MYAYSRPKLPKAPKGLLPGGRVRRERRGVGQHPDRQPWKDRQGERVPEHDQQHLARTQRLADEAKGAMLEVTQPAMDHFARG